MKNFYILLTAADIELIWCDAYEGQDALMNDLRMAIVDKKKHVVCKLGLITSCSMHVGKDNNTVILNRTPSKQDHQHYPCWYYVHLVEGESMSETHKQFLNQLAKVSTTICHGVKR